MHQFNFERVKSRILVPLLLAVWFPFIVVGQKTDQGSKKKLTITGFVTDANRNPVSGAMILIDKKSTNSVTDNKGFYKVKIRPDAGMIMVFSPKNGTGEEPIKGQTTINFTLKVKAASKNNKPEKNEADKDVNIGYGSVDPKEITTPVNKLEVDDSKYSPYLNIYEMIKGRIPGVQVTGQSIQIQGVSSLNLSTEPLFVVDDIVVSSIEDIPPYQVKSIEVLKGAAASIYGTRGANGVILIYMKGSSGNK